MMIKHDINNGYARERDGKDNDNATGSEREESVEKFKTERNCCAQGTRATARLIIKGNG